MTWVATFYSFKGGVGRTMALVNTAHVLAGKGWRVLMVDFDLEAPGMSHFFAKQIRTRPKHVTKDALDLLLKAKVSLEQKEPVKPPLSLKEYVVPIKLPDSWLRQEEPVSDYLLGRLDLLPATLEPRTPVGAETEEQLSYLERLDQLDLPGIFSHGGPGHRFGARVHDMLAAARFRAPGDPLFTLRKEVWGAYDIVLVDSRTGLNELAGISIGPLSDLLVLCVGLNQQNVEGMRFFMQEAGLFDKEQAKPYLVVAGPVPPWRTHEVASRIGEISERLEVSELQGLEIPYHPSAALGEHVFVLEEQGDPIATAYRKLTAATVDAISRMWDDVQDLDKPHVRPFVGRSPDPLQALDQPVRLGRLADLEVQCRGARRGLTCATARTLLKHADPVKDSWALGAAVASLRLGDQLPFVRASEFLRRGPFPFLSDEDYLWLLLLWLRQYSWPAEEFPKRLKPLLESSLFLGVSSSLPVEANLLISRVPEGVDLGATSRLADWRRKWDALVAERNHVLPMLGSLRGPARVSLDELSLVLPAIMVLVAGLEAKAPTQAREVVQKQAGMYMLRLRGHFERSQLREALREWPRGAWTEALSGAAWSGSRLWTLLETSVSSAFALALGVDSIDDIIGWLRLARERHGYAWRVLLNWHHLSEVKDHPLFQEFMAEEDREVEAIEARIDSGEIPL